MRERERDAIPFQSPDCHLRARSSHDLRRYVLCAALCSFLCLCVCLGQLATPSTRSSVGNLKLRTTCKYNTLIVWSMYCILSVHYFSGKTARKEGRRRGNCASALTHSAIFRGVFWQSGVSFLQTNREPPLSLRRSVRLSVSATDRRSARHRMCSRRGARRTACAGSVSIPSLIRRCSDSADSARSHGRTT